VRAQWGKVSAGLSGALSGVYHWVDDGRTACGIKLPPVYGVFRENNVKPRDRVKCTACSKARKP
jgi:hypothetical protein